MERDEILSRMDAEMRPHIDDVMQMYEAPFARFLGLEIVSISSNRVECSMEVAPELMNSMGRGHGGAVYSLMDHTFAIACNIGRRCTGQSSVTTYYRPAKGVIRAVCVPINRSRSLETYDVRAYSEEGKLVASAQCTAFVLGRDRFGRKTLPILRRARAEQQHHLS